MIKLEAKKVDKVLKEKLPAIFEFRFNGILFLMGGALRDIFLNKEPKDFDLILLTQEKDNIKEFIEKYKLNYRYNSFGAYKIKYNEYELDLVSKNDLYNALVYNIDGLFYDVKSKVFIPFGFNDCFDKGEIKELNSNNKHPNEKRNAERKQKLDKFFDEYKGVRL